MDHIHSSVTELPTNCHRAADRMSQALKQEDQYADLSDSCRRKLTDLEQTLSREVGENIALVAYRL